NDGGEGDWELGSAAQVDEWDYWNDERERYIASHLKYEGRERYYDPEVYGAEELDLYGDWVYTRDYGYIWRPSVTVINNYNDWAPRSEEHTSELQSHLNLVCRLLLEKKNLLQRG